MSEECCPLITVISTLLAFVVGIISALLVYYCIKRMYPLCIHRQKESAVVNVQIDRNNGELSSSNPVYEIVSTEKYSERTPSTEMELEENAAYGYFETGRDS